MNSKLIAWAALAVFHAVAVAGVQDGLDALTTKKYDVARGHFESEPKDPEGLFQLGLMAFNGLGEAKNETRASELFKRASELGHVRAKIQYAYALGNGRGVEKSGLKAIDALKELAQDGNAEAMSTLGRVYKFGWWDQPVNAKDGIAWFEKAAAAGDNMARLNLGYSYMLGDGVEKNEKEGVRWFKLGAENDYPAATLEYARALSAGSGGLEKNETEAFAMIRKVAESGNRIGQHDMASALMYGRGVARDDRQAARWMDASARQGYVPAQSMMGDMFRLGRGFPVSRIEAFKWYTIAIANQTTKAAERDIRLRSGLASEMSQAATEDGMRRAKAFAPQPGFKPLAAPLPDMPRGNSFSLGGKDIKVSLPAGFTNTWESSDVVRRTYPNELSLVSVLFTMGHKDDMDNVKLGVSSGFRQIYLSKAFNADDIDVKADAFEKMKALFKSGQAKSAEAGSVSNIKSLADDETTLSVSRTINRNPQFLQGIGLMRLKGRVFEFEVTGFRHEQMEDLHRIMRDFATSMVNANTGFFNQ